MKRNQRTENVAVAPSNGAEVLPKSPEIVELLAKVDNALEAGNPKSGLDAIARAKSSSPWSTNALGVCRLRLGDVGGAVNVFRGLALASGGLLLRPDVPAVFKTNYATALLVADNKGGFLSILEELSDADHPAVGRLRGAIERWKQTLTFWQRLAWTFGGQPDKPVSLDFPPGDLD